MWTKLVVCTAAQAQFQLMDLSTGEFPEKEKGENYRRGWSCVRDHGLNCDGRQGGKSKTHEDGTTSGRERTRPIYFRLLGDMQTRTGCDTGVFLLQRNSVSCPL
jgi:hypothetical protein